MKSAGHSVNNTPNLVQREEPAARYSNGPILTQQYLTNRDKFPVVVSLKKLGHAKNGEVLEDASLMTSPTTISTRELLGKYRYRYFASPLEIYHPTAPISPAAAAAEVTPTFRTSAISKRTAAAAAAADFRSQIIPPTPPTHTQATQTDYRESETQTDPYSPPYVTRPGTQPEILQLTHFTWKKGLPAGRMEIEMIHRMRARRAGSQNDSRQLMIQASGGSSEKIRHPKVLQTPTDPSIESWLYENERQKHLRDTKLQLLARSLDELREKHGDLIQERLRTLWKRRHREKEMKITSLLNGQRRDFQRLMQKKSRAIANGHLMEGPLVSFSVADGDNNNNNNNNNNSNNKNELEKPIKCNQRACLPKETACIRFPSNKTAHQNHNSYSDLSGLDQILPRMILSKSENGRPLLGIIPHAFTKSIRQMRFERDLEEAYLKLLEKKQNGLSFSFLPKVNDQTAIRPFSAKSPQPITEEEEKESADAAYEHALNTVLNKLLSEHWEYINHYFSSLMPAKTELEELST